MAHCPADKLTDLKDVLSEIRGCAEIREANPGIFYLRRIAFLRFHLRQERRWVDVKCGLDWGPPVDVPFNPGAKFKQDFLARIRRNYSATRAATTSRRRGRQNVE